MASACSLIFPEHVAELAPGGVVFGVRGSTHNKQHDVSAEWVVVPICCNMDTGRRDFYRLDRYWRSMGFIPVHWSQGWMFFEGGEVEPTDFGNSSASTGTRRAREME